MKHNSNSSQGPHQNRSNDNLAMLRAHAAQGRSGTSAAHGAKISGDTIRQYRLPRVRNSLDLQIDCVGLWRSQQSDTSLDLAREEERTKSTSHSVAKVPGASGSMGAHTPRPGSSRPTCRWLCSAGGVADCGSKAIAVAGPRLATSDLKVQSMLLAFTAYLLHMAVDRNAIWKIDATRDR